MGQGLDSLNDINVTEQNGVIILRQKTVPELDKYPFPDRNLSSRYRHNYFSYWMKPVATMRSSAGCRFRCSFCSLWETYKGNYYIRKPENVLKEILEIKENIIYFCDDESFLEPSNMFELAQLIKKMA
jgi:radical SAM superfamily enzyme YgiQ (UPF0313 family)